MKPAPSEIKRQLRADLKEKGISYVEMSGKTGYTPGTLKSELTARKPLSARMADRLSAAFGYSVLWLLHGTGGMYGQKPRPGSVDAKEYIVSVKVTVTYERLFAVPAEGETEAVRMIQKELSGAPSRVFDLTTESQTGQRSEVAVTGWRPSSKQPGIENIQPLND